MGSLWNRSGLVERYADDLRATGAKAYFFNGGTTTPLVVYQDSGEAAAHTHPLVADASGRWPDVFVPYITSYDVRVTSADNVQLTFSRQIPNPDPVELSVTVDPLQAVVTGMIHPELINSTKAGYVRLNGRNIGNAASTNPNTERANADTANLFTYLWNNCTDAIAPVSGGRGANAGADFAANKTITLPNLQGAVPIGLDDMGATAGGFFSGLTFGVGSAIAPGSRTGANGAALNSSNLPAHAHSGTTNPESAHTHTGTTSTESASHTHTGTSDSQGAHQHDAFINDPTHTHSPSSGTGFKSSDLGGVGTGAGAGGAQVTIAPAATGVRVKSTSGGAADDKVSSAGAHTHTTTTGVPSATHTHSFVSAAGSAHAHTFNTDSVGGSAPFNNLARSVLVTWFIKL
jgi:hypothetical protein